MSYLLRHDYVRYSYVHAACVASICSGFTAGQSGPDAWVSSERQMTNSVVDVIQSVGSCFDRLNYTITISEREEVKTRNSNMSWKKNSNFYVFQDKVQIGQTSIETRFVVFVIPPFELVLCANRIWTSFMCPTLSNQALSWVVEMSKEFKSGLTWSEWTSICSLYAFFFAFSSWSN